MDPKFQTSFIPKKPIVAGGMSTSTVPTANQSTSIFSIIAGVVLALTIVAGLGLFGYKYQLNKQILALETDLNVAKSAFELETIKNLVNTSQRIASAKKLLDEHTTMGTLFSFLESDTVKRIQFTKLSYINKGGANGNAKVSLDINTPSYNALAVQWDNFKANKDIASSTFSGFKLSEQGDIGASFEASLKPDLLSYKKTIGTLVPNTPSTSAVSPTVPTVSSTTSATATSSKTQ